MSGPQSICRTAALLVLGFLGVAASASLPGCSSGTGEESAIGSQSMGLAKGTPGAVNGDADYCSNPANKCVAGEGACVDKTQCVTGNGCVNKFGRRYGLSSGVDVCTPYACYDGIKNGTETGVDCGGTGGCGPCLPNCSAGTNGSSTFCSTGACLCGRGQGACTSAGDCQGGLTCSTVPAAQFGLPPKTKVCIAPHCIDKVLNGGETGIDCGGADCGPCLGACSGTLGSETYCDGCLCGAGQGDCDATTQCASGLVCGGNQGAKFGFGASVDVCVDPHCTNGVIDGGETDVDCGGVCGSCSNTVGDLDGGGNHACAIVGGAVKCWGYNSQGQVGNGTATTQAAPVVVSGLTTGYALVAAGAEHSCAVSSANVVNCWGRGTEGQLGNSAQSSSLTPVTVTSPPAGITRLRAGGNVTCALTSAGTVWCWGDNINGQVGNGTVGGVQTTPAQVSGITTAVDIAVGLGHACAALADGTVRCWGASASRQLGDNTTASSGVPKVAAIPGGVLAVAVSAGSDSSCARISDGTVYCWGNNAENILAIGTAQNGRIPAQVVGVTGVTALASGATSTCVVRTDRNVMCWGYGFRAEIGAGATQRVYAPTIVQNTLARGFALAGGDHFMCMKTTVGGVSCWGDDNLSSLGKGTVALRATPTAVSSAPASVTAVSAGDVSSCAVAGGALYCWGTNDSGQLGDGTDQQRRVPTLVSGGFTDVTGVAVGGASACAVRSGGTGLCWGSNGFGQLGNGTTTSSAVPVAVSGLTAGTAIGIGVAHACALRTGGTVACWGRNTTGELGNGTTSQSNVALLNTIAGATALSVGQRHSCAIVAGGAIQCWGNNVAGQIGNGTTSTTGQLTPAAVAGLSGAATAVAAGQLHTCALVSGAVYCWGDNSSGQLGNGSAAASSLTPVQVSGLSGVTAIGSWGSHTCALLSTGSARCWGLNTRGNLGNGVATAFSNTPVAVSGLTFSFLSVGGRHNCGKYSNGSLRCWGYNDYGQVGDATSWLFPVAGSVSL